MKRLNTENTQEETDDIQPLFLVNDYWPVYAVRDDSDMEKIEAMNLQFCYLLINQQVKDNNATRLIPSVIKMVNTDFGYAKIACDFETIGIKGKAVETAGLKLPKLSWEIVQNMDRFFRAAFSKDGTESVVMLTYDMNQLESDNPSSGWGFFVPKQNNTATDCNYDIPEVHEHLKPGEILAGTAHSHPEMKAYVSGTDHADQATWEGIHMTAGWFKGKQTEWFIQATIGGQQWDYSADVMIESPPLPETTYPDLEDHLAKVSKYVAPNAWQQGNGFGYGSYGGVQSGQSKSVTTGPRSTGPTIKGPVLYLPETAPDPRQNTIVVLQNVGEAKCRACGAPLTPKTDKHARCYACSTFFVPLGKTWDQINTIRAANELPESPLLEAELAPAEIYLWTRNANSSGGLVDDFEKVLEITGATAKK